MLPVHGLLIIGLGASIAGARDCSLIEPHDALVSDHPSPEPLIVVRGELLPTLLDAAGHEVPVSVETLTSGEVVADILRPQAPLVPGARYVVETLVDSQAASFVVEDVVDDTPPEWDGSTR